MTDLNTLDDWWNEGFDDSLAGRNPVYPREIDDLRLKRAYCLGWNAAQAYARALRGTDE